MLNNKWVLWIALAIVIIGCGTQATSKQSSKPIQSTTQQSSWEDNERDHANDQSTQQANDQPIEQMKPFASAARPVIEQGRTPATESEMNVLTTLSETYFETKELAEIMSKSKNGDPEEGVPLKSGSGISMFYRTSQPYGAGEVPLIAVSYGLGANAIESHALFWHENGIWRSQPYPQAAEEIAKKREEILSKGPFFSITFEELHQKGSLVAVLVQFLGTQRAEEVQLLQHDQKGWHVLWAPTYDQWQTLYGSHIEFHDGIYSFTADRSEIKDPNHKWQEVWKLQGSKYMMVSSTK